MVRPAKNEGTLKVVYRSSALRDFGVGDYYPFGMAQEGSWQNDPNNPDPLGIPAPSDKNDNYKFNGLESEDDLTGWVFHKFRAYDPSLGRFISADPIADKFAHVSPYNYAENSPIANIDLWGLQKFNVTQYDPNRSRMSKSDRAAFNQGQNEALREVASGVADEIPVIGEVKAYKEGGVKAMAIGLFPGGKLLKRLYKKAKSAFKKADDAVEITIDGARHPESAQHLQEAIDSGLSNEGVIDRAGASSRRRKNLKGVKTKKGFDRDEAPPAVINTGESSSVKLINSSDNRGSGSSIGHQIRDLDDGTKVRIVPRNLPD